MIGAIAGDIIGSIYEFENIKTKDFPLFLRRSDYTDDSVMTVAVADWLLNGGEMNILARWEDTADVSAFGWEKPTLSLIIAGETVRLCV